VTKLTPDNWQPPYPAFVTDVADPYLTISQLAVQSSGDDEGVSTWDELTGLVNGAAGLLHHEHVFHEDDNGFRNDILLAYWSAPDDFVRWRAGDSPARFVEQDRTGNTGVWIEAFSSPSGHFETSYSRGTVDFGISCHHATREDPIHGYYGAMRDRIPAAEDGGVPATVSRLNRELQPDSKGRHLSVELPANLCFIRTVQGWLACTEEERDYFMENTFPHYKTGVGYLQDNPIESNCVSARLVSDAASEENKPQAETLAWFLSLTDLEAWTWNHPTHDAIITNFMAHAQKFNFDVDVLLGHEVSIVPADGGLAEYHNCHPATGFLRFFDSVDCDPVAV
jgi:heme-degrading monooxygenase HmoA